MNVLPHAMALANIHIGHHGREVEGRDARHHTQRLADLVDVDTRGRLLAVGTLDELRDAAGELEVLEATRDLTQGVGGHLAVLRGQQRGELGATRVHEVPDAEHDLGALRDRRRAPGRECGLRGRDRAVDLFDAREVDARACTSRGRVIHRAPSDRSVPATIDATDPVADPGDVAGGGCGLLWQAASCRGPRGCGASGATRMWSPTIPGRREPGAGRPGRRRSPRPSVRPRRQATERGPTPPGPPVGVGPSPAWISESCRQCAAPSSPGSEPSSVAESGIVRCRARPRTGRPCRRRWRRRPRRRRRRHRRCRRHRGWCRRAARPRCRRRPGRSLPCRRRRRRCPMSSSLGLVPAFSSSLLSRPSPSWSSLPSLMPSWSVSRLERVGADLLLLDGWSGRHGPGSPCRP